MAKVINKCKGFALFAPANTQDTNYTLIDYGLDRFYLIDIHDVVNTEEELSDYGLGGILWDTLKDLSDIAAVKDAAWKII